MAALSGLQVVRINELQSSLSLSLSLSPMDAAILFAPIGLRTRVPEQMEKRWVKVRATRAD